MMEEYDKLRDKVQFNDCQYIEFQSLIAFLTERIEDIAPNVFNFKKCGLYAFKICSQGKRVVKIKCFKDGTIMFDFKRRITLGKLCELGGVLQETCRILKLYLDFEEQVRKPNFQATF